MYCKLYTVSCTLYTVSCILHNCSTQLFQTIFHLIFSPNFFTQFFHTIFPPIVITQFVNPDPVCQQKFSSTFFPPIFKRILFKYFHPTIQPIFSTHFSTHILHTPNFSNQFFEPNLLDPIVYQVFCHTIFLPICFFTQFFHLIFVTKLFHTIYIAMPVISQMPPWSAVWLMWGLCSFSY